MNPVTAITNQIPISVIQVGKPTNKIVAYAAECLKQKLIYIGQTGDQWTVASINTYQT